MDILYTNYSDQPISRPLTPNADQIELDSLNSPKPNTEENTKTHNLSNYQLLTGQVFFTLSETPPGTPDCKSTKSAGPSEAQPSKPSDTSYLKLDHDFWALSVPPIEPCQLINLNTPPKTPVPSGSNASMSNLNGLSKISPELSSDSAVLLEISNNTNHNGSTESEVSLTNFMMTNGDSASKVRF